MIKISSNSQYVEVQRMVDYTTNDGLPGIDIQLFDTMQMVDMVAKVTQMETSVLLLTAEKEREQELIKNTPALKDLYDKYRVMLALVKEHA